MTALPKEHQAVLAVFGCGPDPVIAPGQGSGRRYHLAEVMTSSGRPVTVAIGTMVKVADNSAAARALQMHRDCPGVRHIIMTGIAGAVPNIRKVEDHVRLGDLVISDVNGVVQYDLQKETDEGVEYRGTSFPPSSELLEAAQAVPIGSTDEARSWEGQIVAASRAMGPAWERPDATKDRFEDTFLAPDGRLPTVAAWLGKCRRAVRRLFQPSDARSGVVLEHPLDPDRVPGQPRVFVGRIASGNNLLKKASRRDELRKTHGVKAVEMEGAGIAESTWLEGIGYLVVRGTCDYCDRNKNDVWQKYAAVIAAVFTRHIISQLDGAPSTATPPPPTDQPAGPGAVPPTVIYATGGSVVNNFQGNQINQLTIGQSNPSAQVVEELVESVKQLPDKVEERLSAMQKQIGQLAQGVVAAKGPSDEDIAFDGRRTTEFIAQMRRAREIYELADVTRLADEAERWLLGRQTHLPAELCKQAWWEVIACETFRQDDRVRAGKEWDQSRIDRLLKEYDHA